MKRSKEKTELIRVVVESPYAGDVERNLLYARRAMKDCLNRGEAPFASHLLYTQSGILDDLDPDERLLGIKAGYAWWQAATAIVFYCDYGISPGMKRAERAAMFIHKERHYRSIGINP